jgi:hypothetical protein
MSRKILSVALAGFLTLAACSTLQAGAVGGPKWDNFTVPARTSITYSTNFYAGEMAIVGVAGDGYTDLELYVYDEFGNLIACGTDSYDGCVVSWTPKWTGKFTIKVVNRGFTYNGFRLRTN